MKEWGRETLWLAKMIIPFLLAGVFVIGLIGGIAAIYAPSHDHQIAVGELTEPYFGSNTFFACFLSSIIGAILYMPTLLEVPIVGNLFGYTTGQMASGPALSLLLAGPSLSLPNMVVIWRTIGWEEGLCLYSSGCAHLLIDGSDLWKYSRMKDYCFDCEKKQGW